MSLEEIKGAEPGAPGQAEDRAHSFSRRALMQAGWATPVVAAIWFPQVAGAASAHTDALIPHTDNGPGFVDIPGLHNDIRHSDIGHGDNGAPHLDATPPHADGIPGGHNDGPHVDGGNPGAPHGDFA